MCSSTLFKSVLKLCIMLLIMLGFTEKREPPKFVKKLETHEVVETETVRMEVQVTGKPKPHVTWSVQLFFDRRCSSCIFVYYASLYHHPHLLHPHTPDSLCEVLYIQHRYCVICTGHLSGAHYFKSRLSRIHYRLLIILCSEFHHCCNNLLWILTGWKMTKSWRPPMAFAWRLAGLQENWCLADFIWDFCNGYRLKCFADLILVCCCACGVSIWRAELRTALRLLMTFAWRWTGRLIDTWETQSWFDTWETQSSFAVLWLQAEGWPGATVHWQCPH